MDTQKVVVSTANLDGTVFITTVANSGLNCRVSFWEVVFAT